MLELKGHRGSVRCVAFAPDGRHLATGGADKKVILWDRLRAEPVRELKGHDAYVFSAAFSPDGRWLATGGGRGVSDFLNFIWFWDWATGKKQNGLPWDVDLITSLAFSPDGRTLFASSRGWGGGGSIYGGQAATFRALRGEGRRTALAHGEAVFSLALSADGKQVAVGTAGKVLVLTAQGKERVRVAQRSRVWAVALSPDGTQLAASSGKCVQAWSLPAPGPAPLLEGHDKEVRALAYSPDGRFLLSGGLDGRVVVRGAGTLEERKRFDPGVGPVYALACAPDGMTMAAAGDGGVVVWDIDALEG